MAPKKRTRPPGAASQSAATPSSHDSRSGERSNSNTSNRAPSSRRATAASGQMPPPQASASTTRPRKGTRPSTASGNADDHAPQTSQSSSSGLSHRPGLAPRTVIFANVQEAVAAARKDCTDGGGEPKMAAPHGNPMVFCWTTDCPFQRYVQVVDGPEVPPLWGVTKVEEHDHTAVASSSSEPAPKVVKSKGKAAPSKATKGRPPPAQGQVSRGGKVGQQPPRHQTRRSSPTPRHATSSGRARGGRASAPSPSAEGSLLAMSSSSKRPAITPLSDFEPATPRRRRANGCARSKQASQQEKGARSPSPSNEPASASKNEVMDGTLAPSSPLPPPFYPFPPAPPPFYPAPQQTAGPLSQSSSGSSSGELDTPSKARRRRRARLARAGSERAASI